MHNLFNMAVELSFTDKDGRRAYMKIMGANELIDGDLAVPTADIVRICREMGFNQTPQNDSQSQLAWYYKISLGSGGCETSSIEPRPHGGYDRNNLCTLRSSLRDPLPYKDATKVLNLIADVIREQMRETQKLPAIIGGPAPAPQRAPTPIPAPVQLLEPAPVRAPAQALIPAITPQVSGPVPAPTGAAPRISGPTRGPLVPEVPGTISPGSDSIVFAVIAAVGGLAVIGAVTSAAVYFREKLGSLARGLGFKKEATRPVINQGNTSERDSGGAAAGDLPQEMTFPSGRVVGAGRAPTGPIIPQPSPTGTEPGILPPGVSLAPLSGEGGAERPGTAPARASREAIAPSSARSSVRVW